MSRNAVQKKSDSVNRMSLTTPLQKACGLMGWVYLHVSGHPFEEGEPYFFIREEDSPQLSFEWVQNFYVRIPVEKVMENPEKYVFSDKYILVVPESVGKYLSNRVWGGKRSLWRVFSEGIRPWIGAQQMLKEEYQETLKDFYRKNRAYRVTQKALAALMESFEVLDMLPWKYWKKPVLPSSEEFKFKLMEEIADVMHFLAEVVLEMEVDPDELLAMYYIKNAVNLLRQHGKTKKSKQGYITREGGKT